MKWEFTASETRRELVLRLSEASTDDDELTDLVAFLRDDLAYAPTNRTIVGAVLREAEFDAWRDLMIEVQAPTATSSHYNAQHVRDLIDKLLAEMRVS